MINNFYSAISNGNLVDKCSHKLHYVPEQLYLLKNNFLGEFRTALEKAKVRANLGIADSETLYWGNILGDIAEQSDISEYINNLLSFDYSILNNFDAGEYFENITNVREAAITCLDYLSKYKGEGAEIQALDTKIKLILKNLYDVDDILNISSSLGGVINTLTLDVSTLLLLLGNLGTIVDDLVTTLEKVEEDVNQINTILTNINSLLVKYVPEDGTKNALEIIEDEKITATLPKIDEEGNPILDDQGQPVMELVTLTKKGGLYVKDLQPQIDELNNEINGESGKISLLLKDIQNNSEKIEENKSKIDSLETSTVPAIDKEIADIKQNYVSKESLGSSSPIVTDDKLQLKLDEYVKTDSTASLSGITSKRDSINVDRPFNMTTNLPLDPRHYVLTKDDLLKIRNAWDGMEVIVVDNSIMYICTDASRSSKDTFEAWKAADSLRIEVLTMEEFKEKKEQGTLDDTIYYYIYLDDIEYVVMPKLEDYIIDVLTVEKPDGSKEFINVYDEEAFNDAMLRYKNSTNVLYGLYLSANWGEDISNRLLYKADKAELTKLQVRISDIEDFFGTDNSTDASGSLQGLKASIAAIYKPAEIDSSTGEIITPASGLLVTAQGNIANIVTRVEKLEEDSKTYVTWKEVGEGSSIVTETKLQTELNKYIEKDSDASVNSLTSKQDTIKINKPLEITTDKPIDSRHYVDTLTDLYKINPSTAYNGMEVIVKLDALIYILDNKDEITKESSWRVAGAASIVNLTLEEFNLRKENTNEDGSSKGLKYESGPLEGNSIPTLQDGTYYFIEEGDLSVPTEPNKNDFMDESGVLDTEKYAEALEKWRKGTYYLLLQYMSASWGLDLEALVATKANLTDVDNTNKRIDDNITSIAGLLEELDLINSYFLDSEGGTIKGITDHIDQVDAALKEVFNKVTNTGLLVDTNNLILLIKNDLYGTSTEKAKFVTWNDLGADNSDGLEGETLFVKTSVYKQDLAENAKHFETKKLTLTGESEAVITPLSDRVAVNNNPLALLDELLKSLEFDSYEDYFNWVNDFVENGYSEWAKDKNPDEWYFIIKNVDGTVLPKKNVGESDEEYNTRLELFKKGMYLTAFTAEELYETKANVANMTKDLLAEIDINAINISDLEERLQAAEEEYKTLVEEAKEDHDTKLEAVATDYNQKFTDVYTKLQEIWSPYYDTETSTYKSLGEIISLTEETLTTNITAVLKEFTVEEVSKTLETKLDKATFAEIWEGYYKDETEETVEEGLEPITTRTYTPIADIIKSILGTGDDAEGVTLTSLKTAVDLRETIEAHTKDVSDLRDEIDTSLLLAKAYARSEAADVQFKVTEACLNAVPITYLELKELRNLGALVLGRNYRIIDYRTTSKENYTSVIWHQFDLVVTAVSNYELSESAFAVLSDLNRPDTGGYAPIDPDNNTIDTGNEDEFIGGLAEDEELEIDTYYQNCNLSAWEIKYCFDNDAERYSWVDDRYVVLEAFNRYIVGTILSIDEYNNLADINKAKCELIGRGVIYYMKDEFGNECSYDFKSIVFERFYIPNLGSERKLTDWVVDTYYSAISKVIQDYRVILPNYNSANGTVSKSRFYYTFDTGRFSEPDDLTIYNANEGLNSCRDNHFAYPCNLYNVLGRLAAIRENLFVLSNNVFIGNTFISNTCLDLGFAYNTILNGASYNTFGANFAFNIIREDFMNNKFGNDCRVNIINNGFKYNVAGNEFLLNVTDVKCENNTFGEVFFGNNLMNTNQFNTYGNSVQNSNFPDNFKNNELGGNTNHLDIAETAHYMLYCYFNKGINLLTIKDNSLSSNNKSWYQYIHFNSSAFSAERIIDLSGEFPGPGMNFKISTGNNYITEIQDSTRPGQGFVWCPADVILAIYSIQDKIAALEKRADSIEENIKDLQKTDRNLQKSLDAEASYSNALGLVLKAACERLGIAYTVERTTPVLE